MGAIVVGGANGIGLAIAKELSAVEERVVIVDRVSPALHLPGAEFLKLDLFEDSLDAVNSVADIDKLVITAGFGRLALFQDVEEEELVRQMMVNAVAPMRLIKRFYQNILGERPFYTAVMVSIAGFMSSPFFSTYAASKAALKVFIETLNTELRRSPSANRILNVSPGSFKGSRFNGAATSDMDLLSPLAKEIISKMLAREELFIPDYERVYKQVLERYHNDPIREGLHSYDYKSERLRKGG